jgi:hypothetical protein
MSTTSRKALGFVPALAGAALLWAAGCEGAAEREEARAREAEKQAEKPPEAKKALVAPNVFLEVQGKRRRVLVSASVCLREGALELLMCRKNTKEHEAVLTADVDARDVHKALIAAGATAGSPTSFRPKYRPATGTTIKVSLMYDDKGKMVTVPAQSWVKNMQTGKALDSDWVFAGSQLVDNPLDPKGGKLYLANDGDLLCVANFETAMLDIPVESSKDDADRVFVAFTERIPPLETKVVVVLEPVPAPKKDK